MAEILPGVHQIPVNYNGRPLKLYLLIGEASGGEPGVSMLMDAGDAAVPEKDILPYFAAIGFDPKRLTYVMATHPDVDHTGGLFRMKQAAPQARFVCGTADRTQVESPETIVEVRYRAFMHWHGIGPDDAAKAKLLPRCGGYVPMDCTFAGGEELRLGINKLAQIIHLPGHSHGHLGVYLPWENVAIIGDAVHGKANGFLDGRPAFAPTYMYVDEYLGTIARLKAMNLRQVYSCHWADCTTPDEVNAWLEESHDYAIHAERVILEMVKSAPDGVTLKEVCVAARPTLGNWPAERDMDTRSMAGGHLQRLVGLGMLSVSGEPPVRYRWEPKWKGLK